MADTILTPSGRLEGQASRHGLVFRGVRYARPPRGDLRFRAPEAEPPWQDTRPALSFGSAAPQGAGTLQAAQRWIGLAVGAQSEDCLYVNVWTPAADRARRPVMVWLHGGAFLMGSGSTALYSGSRLSRRHDVVVVTVNYRLGALGFLNAPAAGGPDDLVPNAGILDQIAALEWVRDHIEAFGGDPENVTLFGESAGGMSVGTLLGTPRAAGLFHRAIAQSGAAHNVSPPERAAQVAEAFFSELGVARSDPASLRSAPVSAVISAQMGAARRVGFAGGGNLPWQPSVDATLLPEPSLAAIERGLSADVPLLIGTNRHEWRLFMLADRQGRRLREDGLRARFERALPGKDDQGCALADAAVELYRSDPRCSGRPVRAWTEFQADRVFHHPARTLARAQGRHAPTFTYLFAFSPPVARGLLGASHGMEIPFVFGTLRDPFLRATVGLTGGARRLSSVMQESWARFARSGDPATSRTGDWPSHDTERPRTLYLADRLAYREAPFEGTMGFWRRHA